MTFSPMATTNVEVHDATLRDVTSIIAIGIQVFTATFGHSVEPQELRAYLDESYTISAISKDLQDPRKHTIVASIGGEIVGFAMLTEGTSETCLDHVEKAVELQRIYVDSKWQGAGVGKALARRLDAVARAMGYKNIWLGVWEENYKAIKVYQKLGYSKVGEHDFRLGNVVQTDWIMIKSLQQSSTWSTV